VRLLVEVYSLEKEGLLCKEVSEAICDSSSKVRDVLEYPSSIMAKVTFPKLLFQSDLLSCDKFIRSMVLSSSTRPTLSGAVQKEVGKSSWWQRAN
jgi:hypothetical protein